MDLRTILKGFLIATILLVLASSSWAQFPAISFLPVAGGFTNPVFIANPADGTQRLFVVEQAGIIKIISNGSVLPAPFLDISGKVISGGEQGLLNVTFPPQFAAKQYFYLNYTRTPGGETVIARYRMTADPNVADPNSEEILLVISQPFANHNGGMMAFSPVDGFLYIGMGDGGSGGDPNNFAQNTAPLSGRMELLGKLLRMDVESGVAPYAIPPTNPLFAGLRGEIWARGLRNPWRFSFDRLTGNLYIGDVGQGTREEIDFRPASSKGKENYGWRIREGSLCYNPPAGCVSPARYIPPVAEYSHALGCSVTGGYVYRGTEFPDLVGIYFFGDFCSGIVWGLRKGPAGFQKRQLADAAFAISTFGEGEDGSIYLADYVAGNIYKIVQSVTVLFPNGGEVIPADSQQTVQWNADPGIETFDIHFSKNNGLTWILIARGVTGTSILWDVPAQAQTWTQCRVRVVGFNAVGVESGRDKSDHNFTIKR